MGVATDSRNLDAAGVEVLGGGEVALLLVHLAELVERVAVIRVGLKRAVEELDRRRGVAPLLVLHRDPVQQKRIVRLLRQHLLQQRQSIGGGGHVVCDSRCHPLNVAMLAPTSKDETRRHEALLDARAPLRVFVPSCLNLFLLLSTKRADPALARWASART